MLAPLRRAAPLAAIIAAKHDLARLEADGAPHGVLMAGQEVIACAEVGSTPRADTLDVLRSYSALRQGQDRYGKPLV